MSNIVFIASSMGYGGASKMLCFIADSLMKRGHKTAIININDTSGGKGYNRNIDDRISVFNIKVPEGKNKNIVRIKEITKISREIKADIIVGFTAFPNMYAKIVSSVLHIPSIISERGDPYRTITKSFKDRILVFLLNRSKGGVFQTQGAMNFYGKGLQKRGVVIANPIFVNEEIPEVEYADREKSVVSVGRFDNLQKRYDVMVKAFKIFSEKHPDYNLKLYGTGPDMEKIKLWAEECGISDKILFMGLTKQPMKDVLKDGIFIITSDYEGIPNALLEAMASGLPCVSTDCTPGGARLLITDHENGLLAPIGDVEKLAHALCEFAENEELAIKCGNNAKFVIERFAPEKIIDQWERYILEVISR